MSIDYSGAGEFADIVHALAIVESDENPQALGDGGRAFGILQQHPAFILDYYMKGPFPHLQSDTWVDVQIKCAANFFYFWIETLGLDLAVEGYNLGIGAVKQGKRNVAYLGKFTTALNKVKGLHLP